MINTNPDLNKLIELVENRAKFGSIYDNRFTEKEQAELEQLHEKLAIILNQKAKSD